MMLGGTGKQVLYQAMKLTRVDSTDIAPGAVTGQHNAIRRHIINIDCINLIHVASRNAMDPVQ